MESIKPVVDQEVILSLLEENFDLPICKLTPVQGKQRLHCSRTGAIYQKSAIMIVDFVSPPLPLSYGVGAD
jgi:hypothetical protein